MALVKYKGKDLLIPMNEQLIETVIEASKRLTMKLPDGLLDL
jgi:ribosomal 30S subunit maturation factor RimM